MSGGGAAGIGRGTNIGCGEETGPVFTGGRLTGRIMIRSNIDAVAIAAGRSAVM